MIVLFIALLVALHVPACHSWPLEFLALLVATGFLVSDFFFVFYILNIDSIELYRHKTLPQWIPVIYLGASIALSTKNALRFSIATYAVLWAPGVWYLVTYGAGSFEHEPFVILMTMYVSNPVIIGLLYTVGPLKQSIEQSSAKSRVLQRIANIDQLTGVANRRALYHALERLLATPQTPGEALVVVLADVDHFKAINDTHGHIVGDEVLIAIARTMSTMLRRGDMFGRWGGEEFLAVLPQADQADALRVAERMRAAVAALSLAPPGSTTISLGVAHWETGDRIEDLLARADQALYRAKAGGRNRVVQLDRAG